MNASDSFSSETPEINYAPTPFLRMYFRRDNQKRGLVVAQYDRATRSFRFGWALCAACDAFDLAMANQIAMGRLETRSYMPVDDCLNRLKVRLTEDMETVAIQEIAELMVSDVCSNVHQYRMVPKHNEKPNDCIRRVIERMMYRIIQIHKGEVARNVIVGLDI